MIRKLTDRIWIVEGGKGGRYPFSHSLYVRDGGGVLVDCGSDPETILALGRDEGIATVVMTHYHEDHFTFLSRLPGAALWASAADAPPLESTDALLAAYDVAGTEWEDFYRRLLAGKFSYVPRTVDRRVADGERLEFGGTECRAVVAPGHSPGHLCLLFPREGILFLGDYDLTSFGPWYGDRGCSIEAFRASARRLAAVGADACVVSHEGPLHEGPIDAAVETYLAAIDRREEALRAFLRQPRTREEIIVRRIVYGPGHDGPWFDYGEWALLSKHLHGMEQRGEIVRDGGRYLLPNL